jgi:hypothetical protein
MANNASSRQSGQAENVAPDDARSSKQAPRSPAPTEKRMSAAGPSTGNSSTRLDS